MKGLKEYIVFILGDENIFKSVSGGYTTPGIY